MQAIFARLKCKYYGINGIAIIQRYYNPDELAKGILNIKFKILYKLVLQD